MFRVMLEFSDHMYSATLSLIFLTLTYGLLKNNIIQ